MLVRIDKYFIEEIQKNGFDIDYKTLTELYKESRQNPEYLKKTKRKKLNGGYHRWDDDILEWIEISKEDYLERKAELENQSKAKKDFE